MDILQIVSSNVPVTQSVNYSCVLTNKWSGATHPVDYASISGSAHWTDPVLVAHGSNYEVWSPNTLASPGVEAVAEGGVTSVLQAEVGVAQTRGTAGELVIGRNQFNSIDPPQVFESIELSPNYPLLSTICMAGPSPDWFTGLYNFSPADSTCWYQSFEIATYPWDAGTEQGETYSINNNPETPHRPIFRLTRDTVPESGILLDPTGIEVLPVAVWNCVLDRSGGTRDLLTELAPSEPPRTGSSGLLTEEAATNVPCGGTRGLLAEEAPTNIPCGGTSGLLVEVASTNVPCGSTRGLLAEEAATNVPCGGTRGLSHPYSTKAPNTGTRGLLVKQEYTEAPSTGTRGLSHPYSTKAPNTGTRGLLVKEAPTGAPSTGTRGLFKQEYTEAPSIGTRGLRGTRN